LKPARWKEPLIEAWWRLAMPRRGATRRALEAAGRAPVLVLAWHRIADDRATSWTCSNAHFASQVAWLADRFDVVPLGEAQRRVREGSSRASVSLTFDDGYAESLERAVPLLVRERLPFTWFATTANAMDGSPFAHDLELGHRFPAARTSELADLVRGGGELGGHTRTHADAASITDPATLHDEIVGAGRDLAREVGAPVRWFAFAFGCPWHLSAQAFRVAREGYEAACSAYGGVNLRGDDPFHLQRISVTDDLARMRNAVTLDPRQLRVARFPTAPAP
jgi:peptidoglycan/xylan/chitin deacetylase (PgdA/CDA1 family)